MKSRKGKEKSPNKSRLHKTSSNLHHNDIKDSDEYEGAHDIVGEDARASRDKSKRYNDKLI